jgi:hypothetical protein
MTGTGLSLSVALMMRPARETSLSAAGFLRQAQDRLFGFASG